ncbi:hypothetical protein FFLO_07123 [Filobasidium floriforme]|uniref:Uncharacterized protein n=1 Tax=Filobasidium floriforme TaxID=5210 RepID=A0A8K0JE31_9TREE|nr:hypothetical protein FFLO_07123 [Filobasidium floriforme]
MPTTRAQSVAAPEPVNNMAPQSEDNVEIEAGRQEAPALPEIPTPTITLPATVFEELVAQVKSLQEQLALATRPIASPVRQPSEPINPQLGLHTSPPMHWRRDCPQLNNIAGTAAVPRPMTHLAYRPSGPATHPNRIPIQKNVRWKNLPPPSPSTNIVMTRQAARNRDRSILPAAQHTLPLANEPSITQDVTPVAPEPQTLLAPKIGTSQRLEERHHFKTPVYTLVRFNAGEGALHRLCVDSGSSISLMDEDFAKTHLQNTPRHTASSFQVMGLGRTFASSWIEADIHFISKEGKPFNAPAAFFLVPNLKTKILLGNDMLETFGACIDLHAKTLKFNSYDSLIPITSSINQDEEKAVKIPIRLKEAYIIRGGHQARVPVNLDSHSIPSNVYLVDPCRQDRRFEIASYKQTSYLAMLCQSEIDPKR